MFYVKKHLYFEHFPVNKLSAEILQVIEQDRESKELVDSFYYCWTFHPKQGDNLTKTRGVNDSVIEQEYISDE